MKKGMLFFSSGDDPVFPPPLKNIIYLHQFQQQLTLIDKAIANKDPSQLSDAFNTNIQCSPFQALTIGYYKRDWDYFFPSKYQMDVQPFFEWLYLNKRDTLRRIIKELETTNDSALYFALVNLFKKYNLRDELFCWHDSHYNQLARNIIEFGMYSQKLFDKGIPKGKIGLDLSEKLLDQLIQFQTNYEAHSINPSLPLHDISRQKANLQTLDFRLSFPENLHQYDADLKQPRGFRKFLFFGKTHSENKIAKIEKCLLPEQHKAVNNHSMLKRF